MLDDLLVLELASVLAGPRVGQFFAELGATVIKVENPRTRGDVTRHWRLPSESESDDRSSYFACCNSGKQSVAIDLTTDGGRDLLHRLATQSDIVIASYRPGSADALGADADTLRALKPELLYGHITGYGPDTPRAGYDAVIQAESGFMHMNGMPDGPPVKMPVALMDLLAAHQLKEALLLGLLRRERTGEGGYFAISLLQSAVSALANQATNWLVGGHVPQQMGSAHPNIAPYGTVYRTADDEAILLAVGTNRQFTRLCAVLHLDDVSDDERFATNAARVRHRDALNAQLASAIAEWNRDDLLETLKSRAVPAGAINDMRQVFEHPLARAMTLPFDNAPTGLRTTAFEFGTANDLPPPPRYAAHTEAVLREQLGCSVDQIRQFARESVVELGAA
jgi:crotonobetainyl-CoA:carnitine CoA-transferase CaiB-like acyl-CoA transferase